MNKKESMLLEAVSNMLNDTAELGLSIHDTEETSHFAQFHNEDIKNKFRLKINNPNITMFDAISAAFYHTHSYKNIDDPKFIISFKKQMDGLSIPQNEQDMAIKYLEELRDEFDSHVPNGRKESTTYHHEFTDSDEQTVGLQNQKDMSKVSENEA